MRPQLFAGGLMVAMVGAAFLILVVPLAYFWGFPFMVGGALMIAVSFFLPEGEAPLAPPEGYRFCVFCSTPMSVDVERCPHCNGYQPRLS